MAALHPVGVNQRSALPPTLGRAFTVAEARAAGVTRNRLAATDLAAPFHGLRTPAAPAGLVGRAGAKARCLALEPVLRSGDRFSHLTAVALLDLPLPLGFADPTVHVSAAAPLTPLRRRGVTGHRTTDQGAWSPFGLPVSEPIRLFVELHALPLVDIVAVADAMVHVPRYRRATDIRPLATVEQLVEAAENHRGRGARALRTAAGLARTGVSSPFETRLRLLAVSAGLPEPETDLAVRNRSGNLIGWFDMGWPERRLLLEYDGEQHRTDSRQYEHDQYRLESAHLAGFRVIRVRKAGILASPGATQHRIRVAYEDSRQYDVR
ncbi:DUF559 domain-containing protein [Herbiconiux sp. SYSU D00978]|uniref:DUF559 domain-containing protein n=1 Tax=Herbiconiux sp. SYSU D00978 TaxID=2812562 RepID=UPI001A971181|nr:DUF559 domain-containing protein [Herbiconiux sp. SYSU D00978]